MGKLAVRLDECIDSFQRSNLVLVQADHNWLSKLGSHEGRLGADLLIEQVQVPCQQPRRPCDVETLVACQLVNIPMEQVTQRVVMRQSLLELLVLVRAKAKDILHSDKNHLAVIEAVGRVKGYRARYGRLPPTLTAAGVSNDKLRISKLAGDEFEISLTQSGEVIKLRDLNSGFQDPRTISLSYYQASVLVEHLVDKFGEAALREFVASFADGIDTEAAVARVFKTDLDALQASFDAYINER